jgi:hypothetical protein
MKIFRLRIMKRFTFCIFVLALVSNVRASDKTSGSHADFPISRTFSNSQDVLKTVPAPHIQVKHSVLAKNATLSTQWVQSALNTRTGQSLVVWQQGAPEEGLIFGRVIDPQGKSISPPIPLSTGQGYAGWPSVAYNPASDEFVVAYFSGMRRIDSTGRPAGEVVNVNCPGGNPRVVFNPKSGGYTLVCHAGGGVVGYLLTQTLTASGPFPILAGDADIETWADDIAYQSSGNKLLVVINKIYRGNLDTRSDDTVDYLLATLDPSLNNIKKSNFVKINRAHVPFADRTPDGWWAPWAARIAFLPDQTAEIYYTDISNVKGRKINIKGKLSGPSFVAFESPKNKTTLSVPSAAFSTNSKGTRGLLIAVQDDVNQLGASAWAQVLDDHGKPAGVPVQVNLALPGSETVQGVIAALPGKQADTVFRFNWYAAEADPNNKILKLNLILTIP